MALFMKSASLIVAAIVLSGCTINIGNPGNDTIATEAPQPAATQPERSASEQEFLGAMASTENLENPAYSVLDAEQLLELGTGVCGYFSQGLTLPELYSIAETSTNNDPDVMRLYGGVIYMAVKHLCPQYAGVLAQTKNDFFIQAVKESNLSLVDAPDEILLEAGERVCSSIDKTGSLDEIVSETSAAANGNQVKIDAYISIIAGAVAFLCPEYDSLMRSDIP